MSGEEPRRPRRLAFWLCGVAVVAAAAAAGIVYFAPGHPQSVDVWPHLVRQQVVHEALRQGFSPSYTFLFYCGYPLLRFYGPALAFLGALLAFATGGDQLAALRVLLFVLHLLSAGAMYGYLLELTRRPMPAALGAAAYSLMPWRALYLAIGANYPQALIYLCLPLAFWTFSRLLARPGTRTALLLAAVSALALVSHIYYAVFVFAFLLVLLAGAGGPGAGRRASALATAGVGTVLLAAFWLVPFAVEFRSHIFPQPRLMLPVPSVTALTLPWAGQGSYAGAYLGLSAIGLAAVGLAAAAAFRPRRPAIVLAAGLAMSLAFAFVLPRIELTSRAVVADLPPVRFLMFSVFFLAALVGWGYSFIDRRLARKGWLATGCFVVLLGALAGDCLPHLFRVYHPDRESLLAVREEMYRVLAADRPVRFLDADSPEDRIDEPRRVLRYPALGYLYGGLPTPLGPPYHQFAPRSMLYVYPLVNMVACELGDITSPDLSPDALAALWLAGVSHVATLPVPVDVDTATTYLVVKRGIRWDDRFLVAGGEPPLVFGRTGAGLVLASNRLLPLPRERVEPARSLCVAADWRALLEAVDIDTHRLALAFIPVLEGEPADSVPGRASVRVLESQVEHRRVRVRLSVPAECYLRLALSYYPWLRVELDGRAVTFGETKDHFIWLRCPAGEHRLVVTAPVGVLRVAMAGLSLLSLVGWLVLLVRRPRRPAPAVPGRGY